MLLTNIIDTFVNTEKNIEFARPRDLEAHLRCNHGGVDQRHDNEDGNS